MAQWNPPRTETDDDKMEFGAAEVANENLSMRKRASRRKTCWFCAQKIDEIDYKDINTLRSFVSDRGKILPRRQTGTCAKHQRMLVTALERARMLAFLPYSDS